MKKIISILTSAALTISSITFSAFASDNRVLFASSDINVSGSSYIYGDAVVTSGTVTGRDYKFVTGTTYVTDKVTVSVPSLSVSDYTSNESFSLDKYNSAPGENYFKNSNYSDGTKNYTVGWNSGEYANNSEISENSYINTLTVKPTLNLNLKVNKDETIVLKVKTLTINGSISVIGGGNAVIYAENFSRGNNENINKNGQPEDLTLILEGSNQFSIDTFAVVNANIIAPNASVNLNNTTKFNGNVYTCGNFTATQSGHMYGLVFAPNSDSLMNGSYRIDGQMITKSLVMVGNTAISSGKIYTIPDNILKIIKESNDDNGDDGNEGETITVKAVVPRRMSIRLEDGTILKNKQTFTMKKGGTVKFQMCTNNWDTDSYTDDGQGIAGTKVYTFTQTSKTGNYLRVDTNKYFMAVRFHFKKGDYNKQTGIKKVLSTPLESLSVNLPLGSTITADAYKAYNMIDSANVFVETAEDKTISYTDYYWNY